MPMKLVETMISAAAVRLRFADSSQSDAATEWMEFCFPRSVLKQPNGGGNHGNPLGDPELQYLLEIEAAVLLHARDAVTAEIRRLRDQKGRAI